MNKPVCKTCFGKKWRYFPGDPTRHFCTDCNGTGRREPKAIARETAPNPLGERKIAKMEQVLQHKLDYLKMVEEARGFSVYVNSQPAAPCQTCQDERPISQADFSHKTAAGMGGAGDVGGIVSADNGTYSCRCCHDFIEQDLEAKNEHKNCAATISNGLQVKFSDEVSARLTFWRRRWYRLA